MRADLELLRGALDLHVHAGPSLFPRPMDAVEAARAAAAAGLRGLAFKHHHIPTVERAYHVSRAVPEVEVYGGVVLNYAVGGLNPYAVDAALRLGANIIWMPSVDARNHRGFYGELGGYGGKLGYGRPRFYEEAEGITILDEEGRLDGRVEEIIELAAEADAVIATSHLSLEESKRLVEASGPKGVRVLVTHVFFEATRLPLRDHRWMADHGAFMELCYSSLSPAWRSASVEEVVEAVGEVGAEHYILSSDLGQVHNPPPPEGLRIYIRLLLERGLEPEEVRLMVQENPLRLLGLDP